MLRGSDLGARFSGFGYTEQLNFPHPGFRVPGTGLRVAGSRVPDFGVWLSGFGFLCFGFRISDFGYLQRLDFPHPGGLFARLDRHPVRLPEYLFRVQSLRFRVEG